VLSGVSLGSFFSCASSPFYRVRQFFCGLSGALSCWDAALCDPLMRGANGLFAGAS
jgi:hypothetical protein